MKGKWIIVGGLITLSGIAGTIISLKHEKTLAIEAAKMHLAEIQSSAKGNTMKAYTIFDVDNYGRNWAVWAMSTDGDAVAINVYSNRGIGPVPLFNTQASLQVLNVERPVNAK